MPRRQGPKRKRLDDREAAGWSVAFAGALAGNRCKFVARRSKERDEDPDYPWLAEGVAEIEAGRASILELTVRAVADAPAGGLDGIDLSRIPVARLRADLLRSIVANQENLPGLQALKPTAKERALIKQAMLAAPPPESKRRGAPRTVTHDFLFDFHVRYFRAREARGDSRSFMDDLADEMSEVMHEEVDPERMRSWLKLGATYGFRSRGHNSAPGPTYDAWQRGERVGADPSARNASTTAFTVDDMEKWTEAEVERWVETGVRPSDKRRNQKGNK